MSNAALKLLAGAGATSDPVYVDDVFSTTLYTGTDGSVVVPTGLDLSDKGGMIWGKSRSASQNHRIYDSVRGTQYSLIPDATSAQSDQGTQTFGSSSVTLGAASGIVGSSSYGGPDYVLWSFAKQEKFFDIVTYTGDGTTGRSVAHNLGSAPGMILIKNTNHTEPWTVYHRGIGNTKSLRLDVDFAEDTSSAYWNNTDPTATHFTLGNAGGPRNESGRTYVAYLFAHNAQEFGEDSDEAIIKCGSFTASNPAFVENIGFEPQWLLVKKTSGTGSWQIIDNMRGSKIDKNGDFASRSIYADHPDAESGESYSFGVANTGIGVEIADGATYVYVAIRRPHKPASEFSNTDMFKVQYLSAGEGSDTFISTGFPVDSVWYRKGTDSSPIVFGDRLRGGNKSGGDLKGIDTDAEGTNSGAFFLDHSDGATVDYAGGHFHASPSATDEQYARYFFRRAKGFYDVVTYTSNTTYPNTFNHNLGVVPELILIKRRDSSSAWAVYSSATGNTKHLVLSSNAGESASSYWNDTTPTSTGVTVGGQDETWGYGSYTYIAYLFATVAGISKVGSYTGTGSAFNVDCGFTAGAKLVIVKRTDGTGHWYLWDSGRGIVSGNDPYFLMNLQAAGQEGGYDSIDPLSAGFTVASADGTDINVNGGTYLFLAIA